MAKLSDIIISRVRVKLLKIFLGEPENLFYVREITRNTKEEINAIRRELQHLESIGLLRSEKRGNRLYYQVRSSYLLYPELSSLVAKSTGIGKQIIKNRSRLGFIKYAFISQKVARKLPHEESEVDLVLVGKVIMPQLASLVKSLEKNLGREMNYSCMTEDEFSYRKSHQDPFLINILLQPKVVLIGDEFQLLK